MNQIQDLIYKVLPFPATRTHISTLKFLFERELIAYTLKCTNGNQLKAADLLELNRNTLRKKMKIYGLKYEQFRE